MPRRARLGHPCGWTGCHVRVERASWGCNGHWQALPLKVREAIVEAYRHGGRLSSGWAAANQAALDFIANNKRPAGSRGTGIDEPVKPRLKLC